MPLIMDWRSYGWGWEVNLPGSHWMVVFNQRWKQNMNQLVEWKPDLVRHNTTPLVLGFEAVMASQCANKGDAGMALTSVINVSATQLYEINSHTYFQ